MRRDKKDRIVTSLLWLLVFFAICAQMWGAIYLTKLLIEYIKTK